MGDVVKFNPPSEPDKLLETLIERGPTTELYVLRVYLDEDGKRQMEWFVTEQDSKIWAVGALHLLAHRILESDPEYSE